ncbi:MAG: hypothetical protein MPN21_11505 [Thermoanaerobaculia bacterium]|nr:hypothetical protein [Thermoanaerobaculia bacterium]
MTRSSPAIEALRRLEPQLTHSRIFLGMLFLMLATKWPVISQPPVWDGAQSVFPAAITLARLDFDVSALLEQPGYMYGGPNIHGLSIVTWATAVVYWSIGERPEIVLPVLHLVHFALSAWALTSLWRLAVHLMPADLSRCWALAGVLSVAMCPLFSVQAGYMYLEIPILAFASAALADWVEGRTVLAGIWTTLAALVKPPGMIIGGALALCALLTPVASRQRLGDVVRLAAGPLLYAGVFLLVRPHPTGSFATWEAQLYYAGSIPDLMAVLVVFIASSAVFRPWRGVGDGDDKPARAALASSALVVTFFTFYVVLALADTSVNLLPRYYLQVVPVALLGTVAMVGARRPRLGVTGLIALSLFFLANRKGHFYPEADSTRFAVTERSMAYLELADLQDQGLRELLKLSDVDPVFYGLYEHYRIHYPAMGYDFEKPTRGHCIFFELPFRNGRLEAYPGRFHMLYDAPWLGGEVMMRVAFDAKNDPGWRTHATPLQVGRFRSQLIHVRRTAP